MRICMRFSFTMLLFASLFVRVESVLAQNGIDESKYYGKSWAVVIGINRYTGFPELRYAVNDAVAIEARLKRMGFQVTMLLDEQATKAQILNVFQQQLAPQIGANDRLVVFYAGHGAAGILPSGEEAGFLIPVDAKAEINGRPLSLAGGRVEIGNDYLNFVQKTNVLSVEEIRNISDTVAAKHIFYIIDGCYSGFLDPAVYAHFQPSRTSGSGQKQTPLAETSRSLILESGDTQAPQMAIPSQQANADEYLTLLTSRETVQVLTAGSSGEQVFEKSGHGIFTYYLLRALDGAADLNKDCVVRAGELGTYLKEIVPKNSNFSQTPLFNRISGEGEFLFIPPICHPIMPTEMQPPTLDTAWENSDAYRGTKSLPYKAPSQLAVDEQNALYVLDSERQRILKFDAVGKLISERFDQAASQFLNADWQPYALTIGNSNDIWVLYSSKENGGKIIVYDTDGQALANWSGTASPLSACVGEEGASVPFPTKGLLALDVENNLFLINQANGMMMKCEQNGHLLHQWGQATQDKLLKSLNTYKTVAEAAGFVVDLFGYVYVADAGGNGIKKFFDEDWIKTSWPTVKGDKPSFFNSPRGVAVDNMLFVYVADTNNCRMKKYTNSGEKLMTMWGKKGTKSGEFNQPRAVVVNRDGTLIYVADTGNKRIQRFVVER
ncbi:polysaccharide deacetylase [Candidatus Moduliflexus flocculans]|uniref:Polysaccharide deacetylase n=1 Tax=Candidatus Moduliflexus flocculans TaxID=1499966 RepID=A0A081BLS3_9BACT|nr:polysaccharide deacetylase [Candidatus Moduliflexus flocculans]